MPVTAETLRLLMDAGVEGDDLLRIVESIDRSATKERSANAERQARFRAKKKDASVTDNVTSNVTEDVTPRAHVEDNLKPQISTGQVGKKKTAREDLADFESELSSLLDGERVAALVQVRRKKGGALTGNAARLLIAKIQTCGLSPADAADTMVLRNWVSIEPNWLERNKPQPRAASPPPGTNGVFGAAMRRMNGHGPESVFGDHGDDQRFSAAGGGEPGPDDGDLRGGIAGRYLPGRH